MSKTPFLKDSDTTTTEKAGRNQAMTEQKRPGRWKAQRKGLPPSTPTTNPASQDAPNTDVARQKLELLPTDELENLATMHISLKDECPIETRRTFHQRQALALEILKSR